MIWEEYIPLPYGPHFLPVVFAFLHVERLNVGGEAMQHDGLVETVRHKPLRSLYRREVLPYMYNLFIKKTI